MRGWNYLIVEIEQLLAGQTPSICVKLVHQYDQQRRYQQPCLPNHIRPSQLHTYRVRYALGNKDLNYNIPAATSQSPRATCSCAGTKLRTRTKIVMMTSITRINILVVIDR